MRILNKKSEGYLYLHIKVKENKYNNSLASNNIITFKSFD